MSTPTQLDRFESGDVIDLILQDHRTFEALLRELRDSSADRKAALEAFATLHVAHAEAEEKNVYPALRRKQAIGGEEAEHGEHEHAEANEALLAVLELDTTQGEEFDEAVESLGTAVNHHLGEEEQTILNPARDEVAEDTRAELGKAFAQERNAQIDADCGRIDNVRRIVQEADDKGLLDE